MGICASGAATCRPSTALNTEIAGVMAPSAKNNDAPRIPSIPYTLRRGLSRAVLITNAVSASTPPSPLLSAFNTTLTYLSRMTRTKDQKISDSTPSTCSGVTAMPGPVKQADIA
jgi:hypothetical protein